MSRQKIAQLTAQLKNLPPTSPAAKALRAALIQAKAQLSAEAVSAPPASVAPVEVAAPPAPLSISEVVPASSEAAICVTAPSPIYQAIGLLEAELCPTETGAYCLEWGGKRWAANLRKNLLRQAPQLLGQRRSWRVYPQIRMSDQGFIIKGFTVIRQPSGETDGPDGEFLLSGCWQTLPQWQGSAMRPSYFSVYANANSTQLKPVFVVTIRSIGPTSHPLSQILSNQPRGTRSSPHYKPMAVLNSCDYWLAPRPPHRD
jgi:hypothetical protein